MSSDYETTEVKLLKQEDWPAWFDFIRSEAITAKIWRFVNPGEKTVPDNVKPDVYNYTRNRDATGSTNITTETSMITPESASGQSQPVSGQSQPAPGQSQSALSQPQSALQKLEQYLAGQDPAGRWNAYKVKLAQYEKNEKNLAALSKLIRTTVGPKFKEYLFNEHNPRKLLQILQRVAKPSKAALRQLLEADLERLEIGPKRLGVESWLNLYVKILTKGKRIDDPPREATSPYLIRHFVQSCEALNPSIFAAYSLQAEEGELNLTLEELINKFNITYRPPKFERTSFTTPSSVSIDDTMENSDGAPETHQRQQGCSACNGRHDVKHCRNLFEELRPDGWVVNKHQARRCEQYLKTAEGRALYNNYVPVKPPREPASRKRKATEDPESPQLSSA